MLTSAPSDRRALSASSPDFALQSTPKHVALIMDGNRRWARARGMPAAAGHRRGAKRLESLLPLVARTPIETLTLFGFAAANWQRSSAEVSDLMQLAEATLLRCAARCQAAGIAVEVIGRRDRLTESLVRAIRRVEQATAGGSRRLRVAFDYSSREAILSAACRSGNRDPAGLSAALGGSDVDLLIRTGREQRLSDFLLWECAFAELYFPDVLWPDFDGERFTQALAWYSARERRFGR
ncbi:MAG: polyprenyl diphosphate synthase [Pseudomonadales bacterium]